jgi:hypothetical protein
MPRAGFEPVTLATKRTQTYALKLNSGMLNIGLLCEKLFANVTPIYVMTCDRELWWMNQEFFPASIIITMAVHTHISPGG